MTLPRPPAATEAPTVSDAPLRQGQTWAWLSLFASGATLVCCALPALLVALGAGAVMASLVSAVPALVWISEHKGPVFATALALLAAGSVVQWRMRFAPCPIDPGLRAACLRTRRVSAWLTGLSWALLAVGGWFAFVAPWLMERGA